MNRIDEEEEEEKDNTDIAIGERTDDTTTFTLVDQFSSIQSAAECNRNSIDSSKQTTSTKNDRSKYQTTSRPSSLPPSRHSLSSVDEKINPRRRYASDSQTNNSSTLLVTSFLQYLRHELRTTTSEKKNDYHRHLKQKSSFTMNSKLSNENLLEINDHNEILTLIDLLVLRVECLTNENKSKQKKKIKENYPTVAEVDQNLIEYLYYLFTKFTHDDPNVSTDLTTPIIDKNNFVNVCQTLVRNGCFDIPSTSPDESISDATITSTTDQTLTPETILHEYHPETTQILAEKSAINEQETWLVVDLQPMQSEKPPATSEIISVLPTSTSDEQLFSINDNDKSSESESSPSIYLSPDASLIDLQNWVQELDEINHPDGSTLNVIIGSKTIISHDDTPSLVETSNNICTRLTNDEDSIENSEHFDKMSQREKRMQERWSISIKNENNNNEQSSTKSLMGVEFPQISVLRRKFSSASSTNKKKINPNGEINTLPMTMIVDNTNPDQINELLSKDLSSSRNIEVNKNNDDGQLPVIVFDKEITMKKKQDLSLLPIECQNETITNINNNFLSDQQTNNENSLLMIANPSDSNSLLSPFSSSSPPLISISSSTLTLTTNANDTIEPLPKEKEEEKKEEEQHCNDDYNLDEEKKNNSSFVYDYHASGIILINDEPTQTALLQQEKKEKEEEEEEERERPSSPLPTQEQFIQQRTEDESSLQILSNDLNQMAMTNIDEIEERYKKVEIEEIPDDEEEAITTQNIDLIEPTDFIHTDDELTNKSTQSNVKIINGDPIKFDNVFSCYEKALGKLVDTSYDESPQPSTALSKESSITPQQSADDPIALRALQRFEERMNAVAAAKTPKEETNSFTTKGKSSWSGSLSTPRKSLENLFQKSEQQLRSTPISVGEESSFQSDSYIRPRKTFDDNSLNYGTTLNLYSTTGTSIDQMINDNHQLEEQLPPSAAIGENDDKRVVENKSSAIVDLNNQQQEIVNDTTMMENSNSIMSKSTEQEGLTPYRFQLEGRRRLNTLERMRERRQSRESLDTTDEKQQQIKNDYTLKPEEIQDPIIRRALERFDEKNRALTQTKSMNYDEIQDPITRRALMRLESNLKRTTPTNPNETWYTENYTLGSLQPTNDRLPRYPDSSQTPLTNNKTKYVSIHQHYCTPTSNELSDLSTNNNEQDISVMDVPTQPIYLTSNNQPLSLRQRSRSEDMLSSKDLTVGQTTNLDDVDTSAQLQRNRSSNEIATNEPGFLLPNTLIKTLEPNFVRTTESSVSYVTPTQTYSAYSCEYTRPRRNPVGTSSDTSTTLKQEAIQLPPQQRNDIQRPTPYRPTQSASAFAPVNSSAAATTATSNYYSQQPLPTPSYSSTYASNNLNQTPYSEDPIVRRALERFNSQMQNSYSSIPQYQPTNSYLSRQGNLHEPYLNSNRPTLMTTSTSSTNSGGGGGAGYQSIIGRRRQTRYDDPNSYFVDNPSVGDGYSSSVFVNSQNPYPATNHYMNMSDEPPAIPPRFRRENYRTDDINDPHRRHSTDEYLSENINNNNNNSHTLPRETFIHHAYPATITNATSFRPINFHYNQFSSEQDDLQDRAQSTSSTNSSESLTQQQQRLNNLRHQPQRLPSSSSKPTEPMILDHSPSDQTTTNISGDSVFHRLAYTGTKASLSRSSSNSCSNLLNKNSPQIPPTQLQPCEIDFDDASNTTMIDQTNEQMSTSVNKYQRSKSVDTRARLKLAQAHSNNEENNLSMNDEQQRTIPSSKFTPITTRPPPRAPLTPRTTVTKRPSNGIRTQSSNGNLYDADNQQQEFENEENISLNDDNYQPKLIDNRMRTSAPVHRYTANNNNIQPSPSTSSVSSTISRTKPPVSTPNYLDRRDSNSSTKDPNRPSRRSDDNRLLSPSGQRRNIPVSVFSPAKLDNKRPAPPAPPPTYPYESQQPTSYLSRLPTNDHSYPTKLNEHEMNNKPSSGVKTPTGTLLNDFSVPTDKHDHTKKMNVFERLFRANKKKN